MKVAVARVDQRLIHGQVCVGWVPVLDIKHLVVVDDILVDDAFERDILIAAAPSGVRVAVLSVADAVNALSGDGDPAMVLVRSPATMVALIEAGAPIDTVNIGGLHFREGARRFLDYVFLTPEDVASLKKLNDRNIQLLVQDLPGSTEVSLNPRLASGELAYDRLPPSGSSL